MLPTAHRVRRGVAAAVLVLAAPVLGACGFDQATDQVYTPTVGTNTRTPDVDVLNALVVSGSAGTGTFVAGLVNNDQTEADQLTGIQGEGLTVAAGATPEIPAAGFVNLAGEAVGGIPVSGPKDSLVAGRFVLMRLEFSRAEPIQIRVPIVANTGPYESLAPSGAASPSEESGGE